MKTKSQQFLTLALGLPIAIFLILALAETGTAVPSCGWKFPMWFGCVLATHESLAAGLIATAGAIFAAWLAYSGIQEQILTSKSADAAAHEAVRLQLSDLIETLNQVWRAIDFALTPDLGLMARRSRFTRAIVAIDTTLPNVATLDDVEFGQLSAVDQVRFRHVLQSLRWFYRAREELQRSIRDKEDEKFKHQKLAVLRIHLSHLERFLQAFDPALAAIFEGRTKTEVDHRSMGEHMKPFVDDAEKET